METKPRVIWQVEIRSRNLRSAAAFYKAVFDWRIVTIADDYAMADSGVPPIASILQPADTRFPLGVCNYVLVEDCIKEAERAVALGGRLVVRKWEIPGSGWFTGAVDPTGNEIFFWEPSRPGTP